jgi:hypothetical protein
MCGTVAIVLLAVFAQAHAKEVPGRPAASMSNSTDRWTGLLIEDVLLDRALMMPTSFRRADVESTMLEKGLGRLALPGAQRDAAVLRRPFGPGPAKVLRAPGSPVRGTEPAIQRAPRSAAASVSVPSPLLGRGHHAVRSVLLVPAVKQDSKPVIAQLDLSDRTKSALAESLSSLPGHYYDDIAAFEQASSHALRAALSSEELTAIQSIFSPDGPACVHVTNVPTSAVGQSLMPTPNELMEEMKPVHKADSTSEACLVGTAALVGASTFTYRKFYGDDFVRNFPRKRGAELGWHRDGVTAPPFNPPTQFFRDEPLVPELVIIFCLRGNAQAATKVVDFARLVAASDADDIALLRAKPLVFYDTMYGKTLEPVHVVQGSATAPVVELRPMERFEARGDEQVIEAYRRIYDLAEQTYSDVVLEAGEMLIVNNKRCSHARTPYAAKAEGASDRWLQNVYASRRAELWEKQGQSYVSWPERYVP